MTDAEFTDLILNHVNAQTQLGYPKQFARLLMTTLYPSLLRQEHPFLQMLGESGERMELDPDLVDVGEEDLAENRRSEDLAYQNLKSEDLADENQRSDGHLADENQRSDGHIAKVGSLDFNSGGHGDDPKQVVNGVRVNFDKGHANSRVGHVNFDPKDRAGSSQGRPSPENRPKSENSLHPPLSRKPNSTLPLSLKRSLWTLVQQDEYVTFTAMSSASLFPRVLGSCGHFYATEYTVPFKMDSYFYGTVRSRILLHIMGTMKLLLGYMNEPLQWCDVKFEHFGLHIDYPKRFLILDGDMVFTMSRLREVFRWVFLDF